MNEYCIKHTELNCVHTWSTSRNRSEFVEKHFQNSVCKLLEITKSIYLTNNTVKLFTKYKCFEFPRPLRDALQYSQIL